MICDVTPASILRVDFSEIKDFRITCANCGTEITIPIGRELPKYLECAGCNKLLWGDSHEAKAVHAASVIRSYLKTWQDMEHKGFAIGFSLPHIDPSPKG